MLTEIKMERFNPTQDAIPTAKTYAEVFAGDPWNENTRCQGCDKFYGLETQAGSACPNCSQALLEAYPLQDTAEYIQRETSRPFTAARVLREGPEVIAFAWGYPTTREDLASEKFKTPEMRRNVRALLRAAGVVNELFYISEVGVAAPYRGRGLSNRLTDELATQARSLWLPSVMRTNQDSPMIAVARRANLTQAYGPEIQYCPTQKRLIPTGRVAGGVLDTENQDRVFFIGAPPRI